MGTTVGMGTLRRLVVMAASCSLAAFALPGPASGRPDPDPEPSPYYAGPWSVTLVSDDEPVGQGRAVLLDATDYDALVITQEHGVYLEMQHRTEPALQYEVALGDSDGRIGPGSLDWAYRYGREVYWETSDGGGNVSASRDGSSCPHDETHVDVRHVHRTAGVIDEFLAYFDVRCRGYDGHLFGEVRFGIDPRALEAWPRSVRWPASTQAGARSRLVPVHVGATAGPVALDDTELTGRDAGRFQIARTSCAVTGHPGICAAFVRFRPQRPGSHRAALRLSTDEGSIRVPLDAFARPGVSRWTVTGGRGDPVTHGENFSYTTRGRYGIDFVGGPKHVAGWLTGGPWLAHFTPPEGSILRTGKKWEVRRWPFNEPRAGMMVQGPYEGCNEVTGWARFNQVRFGNGRLRQLDVTFAQSCDGHSPLRGRVQWHASDDVRGPGSVRGARLTTSGEKVRVTWTNPGTRDFRETLVRWYPGWGRPPRLPDAGFPVTYTSRHSARFRHIAGQATVVALFPVDRHGNVGPRTVLRLT